MRFKAWVRFRMAWGRKRLAPGRPAPGLGIREVYIPSDAQKKIVVDGHVQRSMALAREPYLVEVYHSPEELKKQVAAREAAIGPLPPSLALRFRDNSS